MPQGKTTDLSLQRCDSYVVQAIMACIPSVLVTAEFEPMNLNVGNKREIRQMRDTVGSKGTGLTKPCCERLSGTDQTCQISLA